MLFLVHEPFVSADQGDICVGDTGQCFVVKCSDLFLLSQSIELPTERISKMAAALGAAWEEQECDPSAAPTTSMG